MFRLVVRLSSVLTSSNMLLGLDWGHLDLLEKSRGLSGLSVLGLSGRIHGTQSPDCSQVVLKIVGCFVAVTNRQYYEPSGHD